VARHSGRRLLANFTTTAAVLPSIGIALGNTAEGLLGAYLVNRFAHGGRVLDRVRDIIRFTALAALLSTTVSASIGIVSLSLGGLLSWHDAPRVWLTWWLRRRRGRHRHRAGPDSLDRVKLGAQRHGATEVIGAIAERRGDHSLSRIRRSVCGSIWSARV